jgi:hypothetical protein
MGKVYTPKKKGNIFSLPPEKLPLLLFNTTKKHREFIQGFTPFPPYCFYL